MIEINELKLESEFSKYINQNKLYEWVAEKGTWANEAELQDKVIELIQKNKSDGRFVLTKVNDALRTAGYTSDVAKISYIRSHFKLCCY